MSLVVKMVFPLKTVEPIFINRTYAKVKFNPPILTNLR